MYLCYLEGHDDHPGIEDREDIVVIIFGEKDRGSRKFVNKSRFISVEELHIIFVTYLKDSNPSLLEYNVEKLFMG